ncbi:MAG: thiol reductant ABC exporter subunit CydD [Gammaproteobacteria bacterium]|nr:thiol reductant ABC exporter subunit CydD [Gammaproteobacteria bacterium]MBU1555409.1 thiol reductant ABC exporter subunit CydD [Gammaproteobacteria bacterium]MBU2070060.1 thiol reductant ABC exporter subunit CydD [Gammaproteobacteria bacterium]MBU2183644.1 thiol reductant ABC exporter subunit CydD [Gammaproteobacteria bacterium]MBU2205594.1 thiol reductant ABC exporter subunit CydD [Gammaproteobacteria bacterium]
MRCGWSLKVTKARRRLLSNTTTPLQQLNQLLQPVKSLLNQALLLAILAAGLFILQAYLLSLIFADWLSAVATTSSPTMTLLTQWLPLLALCLLGRPLLQYGREQLCVSASQHVRSSLRQQLLQRIADAGPGKSRYGSDGSISTTLLEQTDALDGFISRYYVQRYLVLITPILLAIATACYSLLAATILLLTAPLVPMFMILLGNAAASASQQQFTELARMGGRFLDLVRGLPTLRQLNAVDRAANSVANAAERYRDSSMKVLKMAFLSGAVLEFFSALAIALLALYLGLGLLGILPWAKGETPVPYQGALFILLLAPEFYAPLRQLGSDYHAKAQAEAAITQMQPILQRKAWHHSGALPFALLAPAAINISQLSIVGDAGRQRLAPISISIAAGGRIALQGPSGCGKSSLLHALLGFTPYQGEILLNQQSLSDINLAQWQAHLGYMAQRSCFMAASIADNLRLAAPTATDEQLKQVLHQVELWPLISQLPQGIYTLLGERGLGLSGGQLQRLALAQLLLRNANIWLLDEPAAHLDSATAYRLNQLIGQLSAGKTVLLVSHQLHGLDWLDQVIQLPDGTTALTSEAKYEPA